MAFWLKRMESFLESVDQTAAVQIGSLKNDEPHRDTDGDSPNSHSQTTKPLNSSIGKSKTTTPAPSKPLDDEDIFKFLNDDTTPPPSTVQRLAMPAPKPKKEPKAAKKTPTPTTPTNPRAAPTPTNTPARPTTPSVPPSTPNPTPVSPTTTPPTTPSIPPSPSLTPTPMVSPPTSLASTPAPVTKLSPPSSPRISPSASPSSSSPSPSPRSSSPPPMDEQQEKDKESETNIDAGWEDVSSDLKPPIIQESNGTQEGDTDGAKEGKTEESPISTPPSEDTTDITQAEIQTTEEPRKEEMNETENMPSDIKQETETQQEIKQEPEMNGIDDAHGAEGEEAEGAEEEEEGEGEDVEEEENQDGTLDAEFVQKYNDMITENEKLTRQNKLMRQEVLKLHEEIQSVTNKSRATAEALSQMNDVLAEHQKMAHDKDKQLSKMKQQEQDLETALHAKDMQIAGSRAQFEQVEKTLRMREATLTTYQERIEKLIQEKETLLDGSQRTSQHIQTKIDELDRLMAEEKRQHLETQRQAKDHEAELQASIAEYTKALAQIQRSLDEKTLEVQRNTALLKEAQNESKNLRQELVDYKLRATKVLQSKEKVIQEMTERMSAGPEGAGNTIANMTELLRAQQERDSVQQERDELSHTVDQLRGALQDVQSQAEADAEVFHSQLASMEEDLKKERRRVETLQKDLLTRSSESVHAQNESERTLAELKETVKNKEAEISKLKKQLAVKSQSSTGQMELENRLRSTTDMVLQKQAQIDTLLSEKSFLQLQLESTIQNYQHTTTALKRERQPGSGKQDHVPISIKSSDGDDDEPRIRQRPIASLVPVAQQPNFVSQRVVRAANFLDKMSASAGRVMRIYPAARLGVIAYIALIHLLGFFIMASWNPEMHADGLADDTPPHPG